MQQVMKFAELTQEVLVARPQEIVFDIGLTPGRRRLKDAIGAGKQNTCLQFKLTSWKSKLINIWVASWL